MKSATTLPALLLPKPHSSSRTKEHVKHLECRLGLWKDGNLDKLLDEGQTIQSHLERESSSRNTPADEFSGRFSKLIMEGKVRPTTTSRQHNRFQEPLRVFLTSG